MNPEKKERIVPFITVTIAILTVFIVCAYLIKDTIKYSNFNGNTVDKVIVDTTYSNVKIDSIKHNIKTKETIIIDLKHKMKDDVKESYSLNDTASVNLFYKLCTDK